MTVEEKAAAFDLLATAIWGEWWKSTRTSPRVDSR